MSDFSINKGTLVSTAPYFDVQGGRIKSSTCPNKTSVALRGYLQIDPLRRQARMLK